MSRSAIYLILQAILFGFIGNSGSAQAPTRWFDATNALLQHKIKNKLPVDSLPYEPFGARKTAKATLPKAHQLGEIEYFWIVDFTNYVTTGALTPNEDKILTIAELVRISEHAYLYVELGLSIDSDLLDQMVTQFESEIYTKVGNVFGPPPDSLDGDPRVTILIATFVGTSLSGGTAAGYFDDANQYTDTEAFHVELGHSNEREMIYINEYFVKRDDLTGELSTVVLGLFAHEYQHMLHWALDRFEDVWFNEGCSEYAMFAAGYDETVDTSGHKEVFVLNPTDSLTSWDNTLSQYGAVYFLNRFLGDHFGGNAIIQTLSHSTLKGVEAVDYFLRKDHGTDFRREFHNWSMANLFDTPAGDYSYSFDTSPPYWLSAYESLFGDFLWGTSEFPIFFSQRTRPITSPELETFLEPWANDYHLFQRGAGESGVPFHGYVSVDGNWLTRVTYAGVQRTGSFLGVPYDLLQEIPVQLDPSGYGEFDIPSNHNTFTVIVSNLSYGHGSSISDTTMNYRIGILPGLASYIVSDLVPPNPVDDLTVINVDDDRITLQWTAPGDDGDQGVAASYELRYSTSELNSGSFSGGSLVGNLSFPKAPGTVETVIPPDLPEISALHFLLRIEDDAGLVSWSNPVSATNGAKDVLPPSPVNDLRLLGRTSESVTLGWTAPGDDGSNGLAATYDIRWSLGPMPDLLSFRRGEIPDPLTPQPGGSPEQFTITGLPVEAEVIYAALRAIDESGNASNVSNVVEIGRETSDVPADSWTLYQ